MNGLRRMLMALRGEEPDRVPVWELIVNQPVVNALVKGGSYPDLIEAMDLDGVTCGEDFKKEERSPRIYVDEWGITWGMTSSGIEYPIKGLIKSRKEILEYQPPDPDAPWRLETLSEYVDRFGGERAIVFLGHDAFEFSHYLLGGMDKLFKLYFLDGEAAHLLAEKVIEYKCRVMERAVKLGANILLSGDDYANRKGPLVSPKLFREFILPYLKRVVALAKRLNVPFIKHSDGNLWRIIDMLIEAGIDGLHPIEPAAGMDIAEVKRVYGDKLCLIGNVDCTILLPKLSPVEVEEVIKETIAKAAVGGGYILSSSNSIHPGVKPENFKAMVEAARRWGKYPISSELIRNYSGRNFYAKFFKFYKS